MCIYSNGKYNFKSTNRSFDNINIAELSQSEINELFETPANAMELAYIRANLHDLRNFIQNLSSAISEISLKLDLHTDSCPINKANIIDMIDSRMKLNIKESILTSGNIAKAITAIFMLFAGFGTLFFILIKQF